MQIERLHSTVESLINDASRLGEIALAEDLRRAQLLLEAQGLAAWLSALETTADSHLSGGKQPALATPLLLVAKETYSRSRPQRIGPAVLLLLFGSILGFIVFFAFFRQ